MTTLYGTPRQLPHDRAIGIEVECSVASWLERDRHYGFFYAGRDISINVHGYPVEFVSQPLTQEWLKKELRKLYKRFPISSNDSCGIHLHVNKKWCSVKRAKTISDFLQTLSREEMRELFGRVPNEYCANRWDPSSKYCAVNVTNTNTVEFRSFRSGSINWACYCVDLVCYLVKNHASLNKDALFAFRDLYPKEM